MVKSKPSMSGGSGNRWSYQGYKAVPEGHSVTAHLIDGSTVTTTSYGEGWENGYYVAITDKQGGKYVYDGTVGSYAIGEEVTVQIPGREPRDGTIIAAHIYPGGDYDYNVETSSKSGTSRTQVDPKHLKKELAGNVLIDSVSNEGALYSMQRSGTWSTTRATSRGKTVSNVLKGSDGKPMKISVMFDKGNGTIQPTSTYVKVDGSNRLYIEMSRGDKFLIENIPSASNYRSRSGGAYMSGGMSAAEEVMRRYRR